MPNELSLTDIKDIHWKTQDSTSESVLFYRIGDEEKAEAIFSERVASAAYRTLVINKDTKTSPRDTIVIPETEWPALQKKILDRLYPLPNLKLFALTGTNGKTTTTDLVLQLGHQIGKKGISIGTLGVRTASGTLADFGLTSPSLIDLRKFLHRHGQDKDFCVMEASSHALTQDRLHGIRFDSAGWLSFSQDHLDYHKTMDAYFEAKLRIFKALKPEARLFVPAEQTELLQKISERDARAVSATPINSELPLFFRTRFNRNNLEVAHSMVAAVFGHFQASFDKLTPPDGRFYIRPYGTSFIVVDFAHTPDALENVCRGIREAFPNHRLKVLFGCGGDRDRTKRPLMGAVVEKWSDDVYVTSDNPRSEDPEQILDDIQKGMRKKNVQRITERPQAVRKAFSELKEREILLLAGKGHEDYILKNGIKYPYSDVQEVEDFLSRNQK